MFCIHLESHYHTPGDITAKPFEQPSRSWSDEWKLSYIEAVAVLKRLQLITETDGRCLLRSKVVSEVLSTKFSIKPKRLVYSFDPAEPIQTCTTLALLQHLQVQGWTFATEGSVLFSVIRIWQ